MKLNTRKSNKKGFSLVEMLVVIAVIGILTAIAIPMIGRINDQAKSAKTNRNAQAVATMFSAARAAGVTSATLGADTGAIFDNLITGVAYTDPITAEVLTFKLDIDDSEKTDVTGKLTLNADDTLTVAF